MRVLSTLLAGGLLLATSSASTGVTAAPQDSPDAPALEALMAAKEGPDAAGGRPSSAATHPDYQLAWSGSGGLLFWHLGVAQALLDYRVIKATTKLAGISGGAVTSTLLASDVNPTTAVQSLVARLLGVRKPTAAEAPQYAAAADTPAVKPAVGLMGPDFGKLAGGLRFVLNAVLPADAATRSNKGQRLHVFASQVNPARASIAAPSPASFDMGAPTYPGGYTSKSDLVDATVASAYVPCEVGGQVATMVRGKPWIDGGAGTSMEALCDAMGGDPSACVQIIAVTLGPKGNNTCRPPFRSAQAPSPGVYPGYPAPTADPALKLSCAAYKVANGGQDAYSDFAPVKVPVVPGAICPGCRVKTPFTQCDLNNFIKFNLTAPTLSGKTKQVWSVVQLGYDEGAAWAKEAGYRRFF